jgi:hypothetical protein
MPANFYTKTFWRAPALALTLMDNAQLNSGSFSVPKYHRRAMAKAL